MRGAAFGAGIGLGLAAAIFAYSNPGTVSVHWWFLNLADVSVGWVALVPLVAGVVAGYLYHLPARMHHVTEHMRHRHLVHQLRAENDELRQRLAGAPEPPPEVTLAEADPELQVIPNPPIAAGNHPPAPRRAKPSQAAQ